MDDAPPPDAPKPGPVPAPSGWDPSVGGRLTREAALALLAQGDTLFASGDYAQAGDHYLRVVGFDDPAVTAAALLGLGEVRYRLNDEHAAVETWTALLQLGETPSSYPAWRNLAAARVRDGNLRGAIDAYREADRRAPPEDKAEIANRLGWLTKELGDTKASSRYFARGRGNRPLVSATTLLIAVTSIISLTALFSSEGQRLYDLLQLDKPAVAAGEYWRLWSVTLLHGDILHLAFNMYALYLAGTIVERWYGWLRFLVFYLACAAAGSTASFVFGGDIPSVGASGAVFGLFGILLTAGRLHHPVDRESRGARWWRRDVDRIPQELPHGYLAEADAADRLARFDEVLQERGDLGMEGASLAESREPRREIDHGSVAPRDHQRLQLVGPRLGEGPDRPPRQPRRFAEHVALLPHLVSPQMLDGALLGPIGCDQDRPFPRGLERQEEEHRLVHVGAVVMATTPEQNSDGHPGPPCVARSASELSNTLLVSSGPIIRSATPFLFS